MERLRPVFDLMPGYALLPPTYGWRENELYLTLNGPRYSKLLGRVFLDVTSQGKNLGKKPFRFRLLRRNDDPEYQVNKEQRRIWKLSYTQTDRDYYTTLLQKSQTFADLVQSWDLEPCLFHPGWMNLRVNAYNRMEWYCEVCDAINAIPEVLQPRLRKFTPESFWCSRKIV